MIRQWPRRRLLAAAILVVVSTLSIAGNTDVNAPPRFDGAGYAMLAEALAKGQGYREIALPIPTRHAHFPPGYPLVLAALTRIAGRSPEAAHLFSIGCTVTATLLAWIWFRSMFAPRVAFVLALALAVNWSWGRIGGMIQSEPLFLVLSLLALLMTVEIGRQGGVGPGVLLGIVLSLCTLTRHVGVTLTAAIMIDLSWKQRRSTVFALFLTWLVLMVPWAVWIARAGTPNQAELIAEGDANLAKRVAAQSLFYMQRLPDQWTGPFVEVGTVFRQIRELAWALNIWAAATNLLIGYGWCRAIRSSRRRLAALVPVCSLALLLVWPFTEAGRFLIPLVPSLLVGLVEGLASLAASWKPLQRRARLVASTTVLAVSIPYAVYAIGSDRATAQRRTYRDYDAACAWIARDSSRPGPVLARHPAEVYWLTGRKSLTPAGNGAESLDQLIDAYHVAYLLIDDARYANAPVSALTHHVKMKPDRVRLVWNSATVSIYACVKGIDHDDPDVP